MDLLSKEKDFKVFAKDQGLSSHVIDDYFKCMGNTYIEPTIVEERSLHATQISVFSRLFMERILFLGTEIDDMVANIINSQILFLDMESDKPITMYINSPGGSVYAGLSIYDLFKYVSAPINTTCMGMAASMGAVLLAAGDKGQRSALPHSRIMIHQPSGGLGRSTASDIQIHYEEIMKCEEDLYKILAESTGREYDEIKEACDRDKWFRANEAVDYGLIDKVITKNK